ncbi:MAG: acyltransferase [Anaeromyxobacter sp.]
MKTASAIAPSDPSTAGRAPSAARGEPTDAPRGHMPALDGVRGLAVLMVLVFHFIGQMDASTWLERKVAYLLAFGAYGVELFFVLSGFLITGILQDAREKPHYFRNFYMRRLLRIFPLYYMVLVAVFLVAPLIPAFQGAQLDYLRERQGWAWLYGVNVYIAIHGDWLLSYVDHFWSLCVEEHFYFLWPALVWVMGKNPRRLMWTSLAISVAAMVARTAGNLAGLSWWTTYVFTPFRLDGLALGGFLALLVRQPGGAETIRRHLGKAGVAAVGLTAVTYAWVVVSQSALSLCYSIRAASLTVVLAVLLLWALFSAGGSPLNRVFCSRPLTFLGKYSYGAYVYHHFLSYYLLSHRTEHVVAGWVGNHFLAVLLQGGLGIAVSVAVAWASYELVEKRFLGLKRHFESAPERAAQA